MFMIKKQKSGLFIAALLAALLAPLFHFTPVDADDRDLLRDSAGRPYVFIAFDLSNSMNWEVGNNLPLLRADDPNSKFYQAKAALYEVVKEIDDIQFGFGTFNQDQLRLISKHWLYEAQTGITLPSGRVYPAPGEEHVFGRLWSCTEYFLSNTHAAQGCSAANPADLDNAWEARRMQFYSKLGAAGNATTTYYIRDPNDGNTYSVEFSKALASSALGDAVLTVQIKVSGTAFNQTVNVDFDLVQDFIAFEPGDTKETDEQTAGDMGGFFTGFTAAGNTETPVASDVIIDLRPGNSSCTGWDPNDDTSDDEYTTNSSLRWPTGSPLVAGEALTARGDVLPWHWEVANSNKIEILNRLAPNRLLGETNPDFGVARYFENTPTSGSLLPVAGLRSAGARALVPFGETPLNGTIQDFRLWYKDWKDIASEEDPDWECRAKFLLILTDGNENCASSVEGQTTALFNTQGIRTFVVGFGVPDTSEEDTLDQIADRGGTGVPFRPQNPAELVQALRDVFGRVREESAAFASAAVPSVQANVADKLYLTSFTPLNDTSLWDGHVDSYLKPLPLTDAGLPDRDKVCGPGDTFSCRVWDAGFEILSQAPEEAVIDPAPTILNPFPTRDPMLGTGKNQRRVFYVDRLYASPDTVPAPRRVFWADEGSSNEVWNRLLIPLGLVDQPTAPFSDPPAVANPLTFPFAKNEGQDVLVEMLRIKHEKRDAKDADGNAIEIDVDYVLGDIFHSDPIVVGNPDNFFLFNKDLENNGNACDDPDPGDFNPGYRCYFEKHLNRRKLLMFGSNDGQIHAIDAGILRERTDPVTNEVIRQFDNGTGREVFSLLPRATMPNVTAVAQDLGHRFAVDGPLVQTDVFIDPAHTGTPTVADRRWRTVVLAGMREGGRSVIALDVTQPDVLTTGIDTNRTLENIPEPVAESGAGLPPDYVPSCTNGGSDCEGVYPRILWEFMDTSDEDSVGGQDLGYTWSIPNTGIIQVNEGGSVVRKYVAVFGGGIDPDAAVAGTTGNWLYMVDLETGKILYKRALVGAAPAEPAAVDTDLDLILDTVYIGTEAGYLYKVDITEVGNLDPVTGRINNVSWTPFQIFDTGGRQIYFPPSVFFIADLGRFGLSFGTGNRENLWEGDGGLGGRYYVLVDNDFASGITPLTESSLTPVDVNGAAQTSNLLNSAGGWYFALNANERVIAESLTIAGVSFFTTFIPEGDNDVINGVPVCARFGTSRLFIVNTTNGNGFAPPPIDADDPCVGNRCTTVPKFVTNPFHELSTTKNVDGDGGGANTGDEIDDNLALVLEAIKDLLPDDCRFSTQTHLIKTIRSDTGVVTIAPVPVCVVQHNWTDTP